MQIVFTLEVFLQTSQIKLIHFCILSQIISYISLENKKEAEHLYLFHCKIQTSQRKKTAQYITQKFFLCTTISKNAFAYKNGGLKHN